MLATLLPGIRSVRTPLVVGCLYFLALWLMVGPENFHFSTSGTSLAEQRVAALIDALPPVAVWSAAGLAAVLVGSLLTVPRSPLRPQLNALITPDFNLEIVRRLSLLRLTAGEINRSQIFDPVPFVIERDGSDGEQDSYRGGQMPVPSLELEVSGWMLADNVRNLIEGEADVLLTRLKVERENLYNDIDRQRSEAELRFSIVLPLSLITGCLVVTWSGFALLACVPILMLCQQALKLERSADLEVFTALQHGVIDSPTMEALSGLRAASKNASDPSAVRDPELMSDLRADFAAETPVMSWLTSDLHLDRVPPERWKSFENLLARWRPMEDEFSDLPLRAAFKRFIRDLEEFQTTLDSRLELVDAIGGIKVYAVRGVRSTTNKRPVGTFGAEVETLRGRLLDSLQQLKKVALDRGF